MFRCVEFTVDVKDNHLKFGFTSSASDELCSTFADISFSAGVIVACLYRCICVDIVWGTSCVAAVGARTPVGCSLVLGGDWLFFV